MESAACGLCAADAPDQGPEDRVEVMVARQPILDQNKQTVAYELLFRSAGGAGHGIPPDATSTVIAATFLAMGRDRVLGSRRGFINVAEDGLLSGQCAVLPREEVVIEVLETVRATPAVIDACRRLHASGYTLALDDVVEESRVAPLLPYVRYAKLDLPFLGAGELGRLATYFHRRGLAVVAEKVETAQDFAVARKHGCALFQGYFFAKPEILAANDVPSSKLASLRLLSEAQRPDLDFDGLERIVRTDLGLARRLLCLANCALVHARGETKTLRQAFVLLGEDRIRQWITLAALPALASGCAPELVTQSLVRARFCEIAAERSPSRRMEPGACFLAGLLSLLDVLVARPLDELLRDMGIEENVTAVILDKPTGGALERRVLKLALAFERGDLERAERIAAQGALFAAQVSAWHQEAIVWAAQLAWQ
jgi:c-di-GMP-related signal transduction protein